MPLPPASRRPLPRTLMRPSNVTVARRSAIVQICPGGWTPRTMLRLTTVAVAAVPCPDETGMTPIPPLNFTRVSSAAAWRTIPRQSTNAKMVFNMVWPPLRAAIGARDGAVARRMTSCAAGDARPCRRGDPEALRFESATSRWSGGRAFASARLGLRGGLVDGLLLLALEIVGLLANLIELPPGSAVRLRARTGGAIELGLGDEGDQREPEDEDDDLAHAPSIASSGRYRQGGQGGAQVRCPAPTPSAAAVVLDVDARAGAGDDVLDHLAARPDDVLDAGDGDADGGDLRRVLGDVGAGRGDRLGHLGEDVEPAAARLLQSVGQDLPLDAG